MNPRGEVYGVFPLVSTTWVVRAAGQYSVCGTGVDDVDGQDSSLLEVVSQFTINPTFLRVFSLPATDTSMMMLKKFLRAQVHPSGNHTQASLRLVCFVLISFCSLLYTVDGSRGIRSSAPPCFCGRC